MKKSQIQKTYLVIFITLIINLFIFNTYGQNLVPNYSFEQYIDCPERFTEWEKSYQLAPGWTFPTRGTSDYFNACNTMDVGVPYNFAGRSGAKEGNAYMGMILKSEKENYREYLQTKLILPLKKGTRYCFTMYYKLAGFSAFAIDKLGVYFNTEYMVEEIEDNLNFTPHLENHQGHFMTNRDEWTLFCGIYTAQGHEKYLTIGNFYDDENTPEKEVDVANLDSNLVNNYAYYYIDMVSLHPIDECFVCSCDSGRTYSFDISSTQVTRKDRSDGSIYIKIIDGDLADYRFKCSNGDTTNFLTNLQTGNYQVIIYDPNGCTYVKNIEIDLLKSLEEQFISTKIGRPIILNDIYFEYDKAVLKDESIPTLQKLLKLLEKYPKTDIEIHGHTSSEGTDAYNQRLSEARAWSVVKWLIQHGIKPDRMLYEGYGEKMPVATNTTEAGKSLNRRVEFVVLRR